MITLDQYVGPHHANPDWTPARQANAEAWCNRVNTLMELMEAGGVVFHKNPTTGSQISGQTFGGFRPQNCPQGAPRSTHKEGQGGDLYDPDGEIDEWLDRHPDIQKAAELWRESPTATKGWCHLQSVPPGFYSGHPAPDRLVFLP